MNATSAALLLSRLPGVGPGTIKPLFEHFGSLPSAAQASGAELQSLLPSSALQQLLDARQTPEHPLNRALAADLAWLEQHPDVHPLTLGSSDYPALLADVACCPPLLYVRGKLAALELPQLAIVGSRNPTTGGAAIARDFARCLASGGFAITSGLALGIDGCAHRGALDAGGVTLAVMGTGIDCIYPARHRALAEEIVEAGGALVSEFAPGIRSQASNFPRRNRIISALSLGTMVVEAAVKSGSLITAKYALEQQREVFAVPGSINNPLARGCHSLIRSGAKLVESAEDILSELGGALAYKREQVMESRAPREHWLLSAMGYDPVTLDTLCQRTGQTAGALSAELMDLELEGAVEQRGSYYNRC